MASIPCYRPLPPWVSSMPLHIWPEPTGFGRVSPEFWFITPISFSCALAHLASAHRSWTSVSTILAFTPMGYTSAPAHLAFPRSRTGVSGSLDFVSIGFAYPGVEGHAAPARLLFPPRGLTGALCRLDFAPMGFTYVPTHLA